MKYVLYLKVIESQNLKLVHPFCLHKALSGKFLPGKIHVRIYSGEVVQLLIEDFKSKY